MEDLPAFTLLQDALHLVSRRATPVANSARGAANHPSSLTHPLRGDLLRLGQMRSASLLPMQVQVQEPEAVHEAQAGYDRHDRRPYPSLSLANVLVSTNTDPQVQIGTHSGQQRPWPQSSQRRIRITTWRFFNTAFILSFGISKAVYTYQGLSTTPNTLDWILGVFWASTSYWFGLLESERRDLWPWFFQRELDLQLPLYVANVIIAMFATFFMISICFTTVMLLLKLHRSKEMPS
ncbi:hypothetical protein CPB84DRAFT_1748068 [Gymnopilus junonius]|uniref:Uncharacterized protein n=1 Tax=Gymnopilus junonius TaxID=109634 RepID=A0A9P5NJB4_GYMJU|nr:hypothetical protein CPB84DRAFT_1748068 [Gymnopilus junonius]